MLTDRQSEFNLQKGIGSGFEPYNKNITKENYYEN